MEFHSDYYKLEEVADIMEKVPPLQRKIDSLYAEKRVNDSIMRSDWKTSYKERTHNYDAAYRSESDRIAIAEVTAQKKARIRKIIISCILQLIFIVSTFVVLLPGIEAEASFYCIGMSFILMLFSVFLQICVYVKKCSDLPDLISKLFSPIRMKVVSIIMLIVALIFYLDISVLGGVILKDVNFEGSPVAPVLGIIQTIMTAYFVFSADRIHYRVNTAMDEELLRKAKDADNEDNIRRRDALKKQYNAKKKAAGQSNTKLNDQIKELEAQMAGLMSEIKAIGILKTDEYDNDEKSSYDYNIASKYRMHIYSQTMATGRPVFDVKYARYVESQNRIQAEVAAMNAKMEDEMRKQKQFDEFCSRMDKYYDQQENRRIISDLSRTIEKQSEKTEELKKEIEKLRD